MLSDKVVYSSCPTAVVQAPISVVWGLLLRTAGWGEFFDVRIKAISPDGQAVVGQRVTAESGPRLLRLKLEFKFTEIDEGHHNLGIDVRLPFGVGVHESLNCLAIDKDHCRVNYHCDFSLPGGWRGALLRLALRRELVAGPIDSLARLKCAAERLQKSALAQGLQLTDVWPERFR